MNCRSSRAEQCGRRGSVRGAAPAAPTAIAVITFAVVTVAACSGHPSVPNEITPRGEATGASTTALPDIAGITSLATGPMAGAVIDSARYAIHNPYQADRAAIEEGQRLFIHMNCAYCHGFNGGGGMGPSLQGQSWRFGGDDADVFKTIWGGRGKGMPAWGAAINEDGIWKIIAYVRTLGGTPGGAAASAPSGRRAVSGRGSEETREPMKSVNEW